MDVSVSQSRKNAKKCDNVIESFTMNINSLNAWKYNHELLVVYSFQHSLFIYYIKKQKDQTWICFIFCKIQEYNSFLNWNKQYQISIMKIFIKKQTHEFEMSKRTPIT